MARLNVESSYQRTMVYSLPVTHEGAPAVADLTPEQQLRRAVCGCLLWEDQFYESGVEIGDRIVQLAKQVEPGKVAALAIDTRSVFNLRHVPLLLVAVLADTGKGTRLVSDTIARVVQRADELAEFLVVYAKTQGTTPDKLKITHQIRKGLAQAFNKFGHYALSKYNRDGAVRSRDVAFLCHVKSDTVKRGRLVANLVNKSYFPEATKASGFRVKEAYDLTELEGPPKLESADTWEHALSSGQDKKETFERLLAEKKLGYMALLRNLRNMVESGMDLGPIAEAIVERRGAERVLPFRFVSAYRACPQLEGALDHALIECIQGMTPLSGKTVVVVDVSGSMSGQLSGKSELTRIDAAASLAAIIPGDTTVYTFSERVVQVREARGLSGITSIVRSQMPGGTYLGRALMEIFEREKEPSRLIVITDEQTHDELPALLGDSKAYMINVASYRNGVGYGRGWVHLDGFSEAVLRFIGEYEKLA